VRARPTQARSVEVMQAGPNRHAADASVENSRPLRRSQGSSGPQNAAPRPPVVGLVAASPGGSLERDLISGSFFTIFLVILWMRLRLVSSNPGNQGVKIY
jgi:hypothetical protein